MNCWIGTDEAGKGDYFGGIVIAGVLVDEKSLPALRELGVRDSKKLSDNQIKRISKGIYDACLCSVIEIGIEKYNDLYSKMKNLNHLLAWGHARAIENLLSQQECPLAIADKFGDVSYIENALMKKGKQIKLLQKVRGEEDIAVAAASILAKNKFIENIEKLSAKYKMELPRGASLVEDAARAFIQKYGFQGLGMAAKLHFKTTNALPKEPLTTPDTPVPQSAAQPSDKPQDKAQNLQSSIPTSKSSIPNPQSKIQNLQPQPIQQGLEKLWAPWRSEYIKTTAHKSNSCIFCDNKLYIIMQGDKAFAVLNTFPYNAGHVMVTPVRHVANIEELSPAELSEVFTMVQKCVSKIKDKLKPDGFNIGMNVGKVGGAGVEGHLHIHIVPRWNGDTNFMPIVANTKVVSQSLEETYNLLKE